MKAKLFFFFTILWANYIYAQPSKAYLMAYHTCSSSSSCSDPANHTVQLAESNNGSTWTSVPGYNTISKSGSVPDVITRGDKLYLYSTAGVRRYTKSTNTWENVNTVISVKDSSGKAVNYVDPSLIVDSTGNLVLFFLESGGPGTGDPASCTTYPCTKFFKSATEVKNSNGTEFIVNSGNRLSINLTSNSASDPDIYFDGTQYILYISSGTNTLAYSSKGLYGTYIAIPTLINAKLTSEGGIGSGYYDSATKNYWTYIHTNAGEIRQKIHASLNTSLTGFTMVINYTTAGLAPGGYAQSPGICKNELTTTAANPCKLVKPVFNTTKYNFCSGDSLKLSITNVNKGDTIKWYFGAMRDLTNVSSKVFLDSSKLFVTRTDSLGCVISSDTINIEKYAIPSKPTLSRDTANYLISNSTIGNTWYKDGVVITDTTSKIKPSLPGLYTVKTTQKGCASQLSAPYYYLVTDVINLSANEFIKLAPNPFTNQINFDFVVKGYQSLNMEVFDITTGTKVASKKTITPGMPIYLGQLSGGTYIIKVSSNDGKINYQFKMIKL